MGGDGDGDCRQGLEGGEKGFDSMDLGCSGKTVGEKVGTDGGAGVLRVEEAEESGKVVLAGVVESGKEVGSEQGAVVGVLEVGQVDGDEEIRVWCGCCVVDQCGFQVQRPVTFRCRG